MKVAPGMLTHHTLTIIKYFLDILIIKLQYQAINGHTKAKILQDLLESSVGQYPAVLEKPCRRCELEALGSSAPGTKYACRIWFCIEGCCLSNRWDGGPDASPDVTDNWIF